MSGNPEFFEVRNEFYKDAQGAILVYDVGNRKSFEDVEKWIQECNRYVQQGKMKIVIAICANKVDVEPQNRTTTEREGKEIASKYGCLYFETSALSGQNVHDMFNSLFMEVLKSLQ